MLSVIIGEPSLILGINLRPMEAFVTFRLAKIIRFKSPSTDLLDDLVVMIITQDDAT